MTDSEKNKKINMWLDKCYHETDWGQTNCKHCGRNNDPRYFDFDEININYTTSDAAAIGLLPVLVSRGYDFSLNSDSDQYDFEIYARHTDSKISFAYTKPTIASAITAVVLELLESVKNKQ